MRTMRPFRLLRSVCLCLTACLSGCVATREPPGTFVSGGSGSYGQPIVSRTTEVGWWEGLFGKPKAVKVNPETYLAHAQYEEAMGNAAGARKSYEEQRASYAAARKSYQQALSADEKSIDAMIGLARLDEVAGRTGDAEQGFQKAVRLDSNSPRALDALGQFYCNQRRWEDAIATFQRAVALSPDDTAIRYHYGITLARSGQFGQAQSQLVQAVGEAAARYNLGVILHEQGNLAASEQEFEAALVANPRLEQAQQWLREVRRERSEQPRLAQAAANSPARQTSPRTAPDVPQRGLPGQSASSPSVVPSAGSRAPQSVPALPAGTQASMTAGHAPSAVAQRIGQ